MNKKYDNNNIIIIASRAYFLQQPLCTHWGHLILVNSVLTTMISHAMSAGLLPANVIEAIDKHRCAFLWTSDDDCSGGHRKVAWEVVFTPKEVGGMGVLSISTQNLALLSKFLSKVYSDIAAPWAC
jgi:hypothetical protein